MTAVAPSALTPATRSAPESLFTRSCWANCLNFHVSYQRSVAYSNPLLVGRVSYYNEPQATQRSVFLVYLIGAWTTRGAPAPCRKSGSLFHCSWTGLAERRATGSWATCLADYLVSSQSNRCNFRIVADNLCSDWWTCWCPADMLSTQAS